MVGDAVLEDRPTLLAVEAESLSDEAASETRMVDEFALIASHQVGDGVFTSPQGDKAGRRGSARLRADGRSTKAQNGNRDGSPQAPMHDSDRPATECSHTKLQFGVFCNA